MSIRSLTSTTTVAQWIVLVIGVVYLALGIAGFFQTGLSPSTTRSPDHVVLAFGVSTMLNIVHLLVGAVAVACVRTPGSASVFSGIVILTFAVLLAYGVLAAFIAAPSEPLNTNWQDNVLHLITWLLGVGIQTFPSWSRASGKHSTDR